jgi:hypothetical protein
MAKRARPPGTPAASKRRPGPTGRSKPPSEPHPAHRATAARRRWSRRSRALPSCRAGTAQYRAAAGAACRRVALCRAVAEDSLT